MVHTVPVLRIVMFLLAAALMLVFPSVASVHADSPSNSSSYVPSFNTNTQLALDNIAGQTQAVQGAVDGLKAANSMVEELTRLLAELQAEAPPAGSKEAAEHQKRTKEAEKNLQQAAATATAQSVKLAKAKRRVDLAMADYWKYKHKVPVPMRKRVEKLHARAMRLYKSAPKPASGPRRSRKR